MQIDEMRQQISKALYDHDMETSKASLRVDDRLVRDNDLRAEFRRFVSKQKPSVESSDQTPQERRLVL